MRVSLDVWLLPETRKSRNRMCPVTFIRVTGFGLEEKFQHKENEDTVRTRDPKKGFHSWRLCRDGGSTWSGVMGDFKDKEGSRVLNTLILRYFSHRTFKEGGRLSWKRLSSGGALENTYSGTRVQVFENLNVEPSIDNLS